MNTTTEMATFGAGCFWGVQKKFDALEGVVSSLVGYEGGTTENPTYEQVCAKTTGHAEVIQIEYDPSRLSYAALLAAFWAMHDPTTLNRQGLDVGDQYRSVIFYHSDAQKQAATESKANHAKQFARPIVTMIEAAMIFYPAEDYHQKYLEKRR